jgi:DNA-nicking Smr family endonuclease
LSEEDAPEDEEGAPEGGEGEALDGEPVRLPLAGDLDLHPFSPREIPSVVEEYVRACRERGVLRLRLAHGRGKGVQRAVVRRVLASMPEVVSFSDAPPEAGGWGATVVVLRGGESSSVF